MLGGQVFSGATPAYNAFFIDRGAELARVDGQKRTSLIVDPADGKIPARFRAIPTHPRGDAAHSAPNTTM